MKPISYLFLLALLAFSCKKETTQEDLCEGVTCLNGGTCINGDCSCPPGYTGPACEQEKAPVKMRISSITLVDFPPTDNGAGWDLTSGADVYIEISLGGVVIYTSGYVQNLTTANVYTDIIEFTSPQATYNIAVWDYDDGITAPDFMGGINFTPYQPGQNFPTTRNVQCSGCDVSFTLNNIIYTH